MFFAGPKLHHVRRVPHHPVHPLAGGKARDQGEVGCRQGHRDQDLRLHPRQGHRLCRPGTNSFIKETFL